MTRSQPNGPCRACLRLRRGAGRHRKHEHCPSHLEPHDSVPDVMPQTTGPPPEPHQFVVSHHTGTSSAGKPCGIPVAATLALFVDNSDCG